MSVRLTQHDLTGALLRDWRGLRERGGLDGTLPSMRTHQWFSPEGTRGYVTRDYCVQVAPFDFAPYVHPFLARGEPSLLEKYWSVRTLDGGQDPMWRPSLNIHVVAARTSDVTVDDLAAASELAAALRHAAWHGQEAGFARTGDGVAEARRPSATSPKATLYVRALVLGTGISDAVRRIVWDAGDRTTPLCAATFGYTIADGFTVTPLGDDPMPARMFARHSSLREMGTAMLSADELPQADWHWTGTNDGPIYDASTKLTVHNGRVL